MGGGSNLHVLSGMSQQSTGGQFSEIFKPSRRTVGGTVGLMVGLLGAGIKKRERKVVPS